MHPCSRFSCRQKPVTCDAVDELNVVARFDNVNSSAPVEFSYSKTVGTTFGKSVEESQSISGSLHAALSKVFFAIVSASE